MILYSSPEAAPKKAVQESDCWVSDGKVYYSEDTARYAKCTHVECTKCGNIIPKKLGSYTSRFICKECEMREHTEWFYSQTPQIYTDCPVVLFSPDEFADPEFFWHPSDILEYLDEHNMKPEDLPLFSADDEEIPQIDIDDIFYDYTDNEEDIIPSEVYEEVKKLNLLLKELIPKRWSKGSRRIQLPKDFVTRSEQEYSSKK